MTCIFGKGNKLYTTYVSKFLRIPFDHKRDLKHLYIFFLFLVQTLFFKSKFNLIMRTFLKEEQVMEVSCSTDLIPSFRFYSDDNNS